MNTKALARHYAGKVEELRSHVAKARVDRGVLGQLRDLVEHKIRINTDPFDYYRFEFYKGSKTWDEKSRYVSKRGSCYYPYEKNSIKYLYLFNNKLVTKTLLAGFGLPQPKLLATIGEAYEIKGKDQFVSFLDSAGQDLVLKPIDDSGGQGVFVLRRTGGGWTMGDRRYEVEEIWEPIRKIRHSGYLVEEMVHNTPQIAALHPTSLNTIRIMTIKTDDGRWHATHGALRVGRGRRAVDNLGSGGIHLTIDDSGRTTYAHDWSQDHPITHHPDTGAELIGIHIQEYRDVVELALAASRKFGFMGILGWDIACTPQGPSIVEGNAFPDVQYRQVGPAGPFVTDEIAQGLKKRRPFRKWEKTRIHPGFDPYRIRC